MSNKAHCPRVLAASLSLTFASASAMAAENQFPTCEGHYMIAELLMKVRQSQAMPLSDLMNTQGKLPGHRELILDAYETPLMLTPETRELVIEEFANKWALKCYQDGPFLANGAGE